MSKRLHQRLLITACVLAAALGGFLSWRVWQIRPLYLDPAARSEVRAALTAVRLDTGWGASAFDLRRVDCDPLACEVRLDFRYRSNRRAARTETGWILRWSRNHPEQYALER